MIPPSVQAMVDDSHAPTAPLADFLVAYREDDNWWWRIACGHHQNLFEEAVTERKALLLRCADAINDLAQRNEAIEGRQT